jgi:hypothetical protein
LANPRWIAKRSPAHNSRFSMQAFAIHASIACSYSSYRHHCIRGRPIQVRLSARLGVSIEHPTAGRRTTACRFIQPSASQIVRITSEEEESILSASPSNQVSEAEVRDAPTESAWKDCMTCANSGFVPCRRCNATGLIQRKDAANVFYCPDCVGHKKLRCNACGGKCYMCD